LEKKYNKRDKKRRAPTRCGLHVGALNLGALSNQKFASTQISGQVVQSNKSKEGKQAYAKRKIQIAYIKKLVKRKMVFEDIMIMSYNFVIFRYGW
jgi:hypothetical protein